uniref:Copine domain-containing protein n=1 Tax=Angiostrongylus cantonensis TaxID=6313 RepID=A0A0K0DEL6_ANGCA
MCFVDIFDFDLLQNIITQNVYESVKQKSAFVRLQAGLPDVQRHEKVLCVCVKYLNKHWNKDEILPVVLSTQNDVLARLKIYY